MSDRLLYLPLGGAGEIGMNCYVYGYGPAGRERYIVVDLGVTFPSMDGTPGVDLIFADVSWLEERKERIDAIFITHAHEDHVGAVGHLWPRLGAPIYARTFTAHLARLKFEEHGHDELMIKTVSAWPQQVDVGPFKVGFLPVSHSIPESSALVIDSPAGRVIHTGDFKIDETPVVGEAFDRALWESVSKDGVKALVCDSTNVFTDKPGRSESEVVGPLTELISSLDGMVAATTFASNIARVKSLAEAGSKAGRSVVLLGRAMRKMITAGIETGIISEFPKTISPRTGRRHSPRQPDAVDHGITGRIPRRHRATVARQIPRAENGRGRHRNFLVQNHSGQRNVRGAHSQQLFRDGRELHYRTR